MNSETKPLSNLQLELLKVFSFDLEEQQLLEIKEILSDYFADKATQEMDALFAKNAWGEEKIEEWSKQHLRTKYQ
jgi:hypothetical protein